MINETLKEEFNKEFWGRFVDAGVTDKLSNQIADWWLAKNAEHDALLLRRLEEMKTLQDESDFECDYDDQIEAYEQKGYNSAIEDIKLLITKKQ